MRINVVARDFDPAPDLEAFAEEKVQKLPRYFDGTQLITVTMTKGPRSGYEVEVIVDVEKHDDFVGTAEADDVRSAIEAAVNKAQRQLTEFKERLKENRHHS